MNSTLDCRNFSSRYAFRSAACAKNNSAKVQLASCNMKNTKLERTQTFLQYIPGTSPLILLTFTSELRRKDSDTHKQKDEIHGSVIPTTVSRSNPSTAEAVQTLRGHFGNDW